MSEHKDPQSPVPPSDTASKVDFKSKTTPAPKDTVSDSTKSTLPAHVTDRTGQPDTSRGTDTTDAAKDNPKDTRTAEDRELDAKAAQVKADEYPENNRTPVDGATTAPVPAPQQRTVGNVNPSDLTRPNTSNLTGADDVRSQMVSDAAAESSTDTVFASVDPNSGTHQVPGDELTAEDIEVAQIILDQGKRRGTREDVSKELQRRRASKQVERSVRSGEEAEGPEVVFRSSIPAFSFRPARGSREQFKDYFYRTRNPGVIHYIRDQLMNVRNSPVKITESNEQEMKEQRTVVPVIEPLPGSEGLDGLRLQRAALFTKAPRTEANPDPITPETGNGPRDQLSDRQLVSTAGEVRAAVREYRDDVTQQRRNSAEFAAAQGDKPSQDALADAGTTGGATAGATTTDRPPAMQGGAVTGMQNSVSPGSAPRRP